MNSIDRRQNIVRLLIENDNPIKGTDLAKKYSVTRQVIVKDIAILRAQGNKIIATPEGYIITREDGKIKEVIAVTHNEDRLGEELNIIIRYGGIVEDVIVEHPIYGEIKGMLMIKTLNDVEKFLSKYNNNSAKLLSLLTNGIHIHTISTDTEKNMTLILKELKKKGFIIE